MSREILPGRLLPSCSFSGIAERLAQLWLHFGGHWLASSTGDGCVEQPQQPVQRLCKALPQPASLSQTFPRALEPCNVPAEHPGAAIAPLHCQPLSQPQAAALAYSLITQLNKTDIDISLWLPDQQLNVLPFHCPLCLLSTRPSSAARGEAQPGACLCCVGAELCRQGCRLLFVGGVWGGFPGHLFRYHE